MLAEFLLAGSFDELLALDAERSHLRLVSLAAFGPATAPRFAAIWLALPTRARTIVAYPQHYAGAYAIPPGVEVGNDKRSATLITGTASVRKLPTSPATSFGSHFRDEDPVAPPPLAELFVVVVYEAFPPRGPRGIPVFPKPKVVQSASVSALMAEPFDTKGSCASFDVVWWSPYADEKPYYLGVLWSEPSRSDSPLPTAAYNVLSLGYVPNGTGGVRGSENLQTIQEGWSYCRHAVPAPKDYQAKREVVAHVRSDTLLPWPADLTQPFDGGLVIDGPLRLSQLTSSVSTRKGQGLWPIQVGANGAGDAARFCVTFAPWGKFEPKARYFTVLDGPEGSFTQAAPPTPGNPPPGPKGDYPTTYHPPATPKALALQALDDLVKSEMRFNAVHNAQLAVAKSGKLKLLRSYTWAEAGWPLTQPTHRFRWASVCKALAGIRAASHGDAFLDQSILTALGLQPQDFVGADVEHLVNFGSASVADLLRHQSGFKNDNDFRYYNMYWEGSRRSLPLQAGDAWLAVKSSALEFATTPPRQVSQYNNVNFHLVAEALSFHAWNREGEYFRDVAEWWNLPNAIGPRSIQPSREAALGAGEIPCRQSGAYAKDSLIQGSSALEALEMVDQSPPTRAGAYAGFGGRDANVANGSTALSMCAAALVRLLQILHPPGTSLPGPSLTVAQRNRVMQTNPSVDATQPEAVQYAGLGFDSVSQTVFGEKLAIRLAKNGGDTGTSSDAFHFYFPSVDGPAGESLSVAIVCNTNRYRINAKTVLAKLSDIDAMGGFDDEVDLFPAFL